MKHKTHLLTALIAACLITANVSYAESNEHNHSDHAQCEHDHSAHKEDHSGHDHASHDEHDHDEAEAGPNGGRLITSVEPHLEFFVTKEGFVQITFLNEASEIVAPKEQALSLIGGDRQNPVRLRFEQKGKVLISTEALPEGNNLPIILSIKSNKISKTVRERFNLNLSQCPTCDYKEYACTCAHDGDEHEGHDH